MPHAIATDYHWMAQAIQLARRGLYTTSPNPRVGCIILDKNGTLAGKGYHVEAGTAHAEVHALQEAGASSRGGTAYVTLEPCSHFGRTPPCANALIEAGVARVVVAMTDPNPNVSGSGIARLQEAGIEVISDVMAAQAAALNPGFIKRMMTGKPFVRVKLGVSLDGKIALANGVSQWITGPAARRDVQRFRAQSCAILTGSGTARADNPSLLVRPSEARFEDYPLHNIRQPVRVVVDSKQSLPAELQLFNDGKTTYVATTRQPAETESPSHVLSLPGKGGQVDLSALMERLGAMQLNEVWVEAGPGLAGALLQQGEVDELIVYQAPKLLGDNAISMVSLPAFDTLAEAVELRMTDSRRVGNDMRLQFAVSSRSEVD
ncbi:bifunctional diaminohydroxyphosphoribosylaminopyrimidine deaminase/5-amino-6-(5-phosphoribosylamino)uracil reductase RibD [Alteromonas sp. ASW11-19]|uniref:Riboflavin biosynthesis protein RibD n=1 Tax=Alteromonas salexigens TaxID=2982530 RepID=A0ABT2VRT2_9ALTE|nr:bifunctional diaminohydroxyphosphoribosylaminopyrimidine deaminase/5-amino-6-(5-phosphoribosylamino)uracil reductase RibD [Alteromonas salexigens]MCU7555759.1 bifunctional diaminohydroxyphosphoribosylaminopyrimidine deaminase/5-amino-6-(5-phosphoribosylamino)uracil reductase RibD [Alteromonas salexigens]